MHLMMAMAMRPMRIPHRIVISTTCWGSYKTGFDEEKNMGGNNDYTFTPDDIYEAYEVLMDGGLQVFDVAASSRGTEFLGECIERNPQLPLPRVIGHVSPAYTARLYQHFRPLYKNRAGSASIEWAMDHSQGTLGQNLELLMYGPAWMRSSAWIPWRFSGDAKSCGTEVGLNNVHSGKALRRAHKILSRRGMQVTTACVEFSLLEDRVAHDGTLDVAKELGITLLARSPLARGIASGKYTGANPNGGHFGYPRWRPRVLYANERLYGALEEVAKECRDRADAKVTSAQVALQWVKARGFVPVVSVNNAKYAKDVVGCIGWDLLPNEVDFLNQFTRYRLPINKRTAPREILFTFNKLSGIK